MHAMSRSLGTAYVALALALGACGDGSSAADAGPEDAAIDAPSLPVFRNPVSLPDDQLALQALQILGAQVPGATQGSCESCHGLTKQRLRYWRALSDTALATCLTDLSVSSPTSARTMIDCVREMPTIPTLYAQGCVATISMMS